MSCLSRSFFFKWKGGNRHVSCSWHLVRVWARGSPQGAGRPFTRVGSRRNSGERFQSVSTNSLNSFAARVLYPSSFSISFSHGNGVLLLVYQYKRGPLYLQRFTHLAAGILQRGPLVRRPLPQLPPSFLVNGLPWLTTSPFLFCLV